MKDNWKEFKEFFKEDFTKSVRPGREFLWSARYYIMWFMVLSLVDCVFAYSIKEMDIYDFLMNIALALVMMLYPFAYGIKKEGDRKI